MGWDEQRQAADRLDHCRDAIGVADSSHANTGQHEEPNGGNRNVHGVLQRLIGDTAALGTTVRRPRDVARTEREPYRAAGLLLTNRLRRRMSERTQTDYRAPGAHTTCLQRRLESNRACLRHTRVALSTVGWFSMLPQSSFAFCKARKLGQFGVSTTRLRSRKS
jgi:hypothetical protein